MSGIIVDLIYQIDYVPEAGSEAEVHDCTIAAGGGFNAMLAAKLSGMKAVYGGAIGRGPFADVVNSALEKADITALQSANSNIDQGSCVVLVDNDGERTFIAKSGAEAVLDEKQLSAIKPDANNWVLVSGYVLSHAGSQQSMHNWLLSLPHNIALVFDPTPVVNNIPQSTLDFMLSNARWISANRHEAQALTHIDSPKQACEQMSKAQANEIGGVVVRDGHNGCWISSNGEPAFHVAGFKVNAIDTNGAGDAHLGAFIAAIECGSDPITAAEIANAAAAISTTRRGPATAPTLEETRSFLSDNLTYRQPRCHSG